MAICQQKIVSLVVDKGKCIFPKEYSADVDDRQLHITKNIQDFPKFKNIHLQQIQYLHIYNKYLAS